jgi:hypothetical protein
MNTPNASPDGMDAYLKPASDKWEGITQESFSFFIGERYDCADPDQRDKISQERSAANKQYICDVLQKALQLPNLAFFAGSGTSLGDVGGPSMWDLWLKTMTVNPAAKNGDSDYNRLTQAAELTCERVKYSNLENPNIEHFLSQCDAYLAFNADTTIQKFVNNVKTTILEECSAFLENECSDISAYKLLLQKMARRRVRDPRLKIFTTNYDKCFETAASELGMMVIDGFSYTQKRRFDAKYFDCDVVRRDGESYEFIEGIFQLMKLHGSVAWARDGSEIYEIDKPSPEHACLIYPAKGKYQQAFLQPHLELLSRFLGFLRQPNSCLLMAGFGFNDDHLSEPIYSAIKSNPSLRLIVADYKATTHIKNTGRNGSSLYWAKLAELSMHGHDIFFLNTSFSGLCRLIPNLRALSPAEQLAKTIRNLGNGI